MIRKEVSGWLAFARSDQDAPEDHEEGHQDCWQPEDAEP